MKKIIAILFFLFFQFFAMAGNSFADSCYWEGNGDGGYWVDTDPDLGNWSSGVLPADGDDVYILDTSDSVPCRNVTYNMAEDYPELNSLAIDNNMTLDHNDLACPILAANHISVGLESGFGMINQEVGTTVAEYLNLGINSNVNKESGELVRGIGFYQLKGDAADVFVDVDYLNVGVNGYGEFNQFGGRVDADFVNIGAFEERGYGHYNMSGGELCIYNDLMIDGAADGNESIFTMNGGTIFKMPGEVKIGCQRSASFIQYDGYFRFEGAMYLGDQNSGTPSCGQYIMYGGVLDGMKDNDDEEGAGLVLGEWGGTGIFTQNGGVVRVDELTLARQNDPEEGGTSHAYYTMNAGKSGEPELYTGVSHVGDAGVGVFTQNAGLHKVYGDMFIGVVSDSQGTYAMNGGTLDVDGQITVAEEGSGILNINGGIINAGTITNNDTINLAQTGAIVNAEITNNGIMNANNAVVRFTGKVTNNGAIKSDPSTLYFSDLEITETGYITASSEDKYVISGNFDNYSRENTSWDTSLAAISFVSGAEDLATNHSFSLAGADNGVNGYNENFAWASLEIDSLSTLSLNDGNTDLKGAAFYTTEILGVQYDGSFNVLNVEGNGFNIYYDPTWEANSYLNGATYNLVNGGQLIPTSTTPEPASMLLFGLGGAVMAGMRRKKK